MDHPVSTQYNHIKLMCLPSLPLTQDTFCTSLITLLLTVKGSYSAVLIAIQRCALAVKQSKVLRKP